MDDCSCEWTRLLDVRLEFRECSGHYLERLFFGDRGED